MKRAQLLCGLLLGYSLPALSEINFNGFASFYGGKFDAKGEAEDIELEGLGDTFNMREGSLTALQFTADLQDGLTATAQIVARGKDDYQPEMEWAFIGYEFNDTWRVNFGRIRIPLFKYSDYLDVGYAYHWTKVPHLIYANVPISSFDGVNLMANYTMGGWDLSGNLFSNGDHFYGFNWAASRDAFSSRIIYAINKTTAPIPPAEAIGNLLYSMGLKEAGDDIRLYKDNHSFAGLALAYDPGNWFIIGELTTTEWEPSVIPDTDAWMLSAGIRIGRWTPHATYSHKKSTPILDALDSIPDELLAGPPPFSPTLDSVVNNFLNGFAEEQSESTFGVRYDFHPSAAIKADYTIHKNDLDDDSSGKLIRIGVDIVF